MQFSLYYLFTLIAAYSFREGQGAVNFTEPLSGSVISNFEGALNATTITCTITRDSPIGPQITTSWNVGNFRGIGESLVAINAAPELFSVGGDPIPNTNFLFNNELTILNWAAELDGVIVYCGTGADPQQASFTLRIYRPPNLRDNFLVMVEENTTNAVIDLRQEPAAFPEPTMFTWRKNGQLLTRFDQTFSNVTIPSVERADAGNYSVFVTSFVLDGSMEQVGNDSGSFYLDVIYGPSFLSDGPTWTPTQRYAILGGHSSLICGRGLDSNPQATITWRAPDGTTVMDSARYDLENGPNVVRLSLSQTILSDSGVWICEVVVRSEWYVISRGELVLVGPAVVGAPLRHHFMLTVIAPPSQPKALSVQNIGATWVRLHWESPLDVDFPILYYEVMVENGVIRVQTRSTLDNSTFINVTGLNSSTTYNLSVVAVIEAGEVVARSEESEHLKDIRTTATIANTGPSSLSCHVTVVGGLLGSLLAISLLIIVILVIALVLNNRREGKSLAATDEAMYEYPKVSPKSADPKMESCAAYGVVSTGHL